MDTQSFIDRWSSSGASERANKDLFFVELCDLLGVARPEPARGDPAHDRYTFERDALSGSKKHGRGRRDSPPCMSRRPGWRRFEGQSSRPPG